MLLIGAYQATSECIFTKISAHND